jgi:hypothetical protein
MRPVRLLPLQICQVSKNSDFSAAMPMTGAPGETLKYIQVPLAGAFRIREALRRLERGPQARIGSRENGSASSEGQRIRLLQDFISRWALPPI